MGFLTGEGILVSGDAERLLQFIDNTTHAHVLQKYIESPLLLTADRKFDIRYIWVILLPTVSEEVINLIGFE